MFSAKIYALLIIVILAYATLATDCFVCKKLLTTILMYLVLVISFVLLVGELFLNDYYTRLLRTF